jgi:dihydrofolate reductase (trimethoprim resistance protein)
MLNIKISLIVAMDKNRVIGKDNDLPWRLPKEFEYVKKTTMGHTIIMGRKNFESIGRALPGRKNVILTRDKTFSFEGCIIAHSIRDVFDLCKNDEEVFIFGGEQIYEMFLPYVEKMYITKIDYAFEGDTFFPEVNYEEWNEVSVEQGITDEKNPYKYHYHVYEKNIHSN